MEGLTGVSSSYLLTDASCSQHLDKEWKGFHQEQGKEALVLVALKSKGQGKGGGGFVAGHHGVLASMTEYKNGEMLYRARVHYLFFPLETLGLNIFLKLQKGAL